MRNRKFLSSALAGAIILSSVMTAGFSVSAAEETAGDVTGDGVFNTADIVALQSWFITGKELKDWNAGDLSGDGKISIIDFVLMKNRLSGGSASSEPAGKTDGEGVNVVFDGTSVSLTDADGNKVTSSPALTVSGAAVTVKQPGEYSFSGKSDAGQIIVDVDKTAYPEGKVTLNFNGLTLSNSTSAPVYVASVADECVISAKKGTENVISDGTSHTDTYENDGKVSEIKAAIFSRDDLKFKGKGKLTVNGNTADGIVTTNDLKLFNGTIEVNAKDDGIRGKDSVKIGDADAEAYDDLSVTVKTTDGDGIRATNTKDENKGFIEINGGKVNVEAHSDGIQAVRAVTVNGGDITIKTYVGSEYKSSGQQAQPGQPGGQQGPGQGWNWGNAMAGEDQQPAAQDWSSFDWSSFTPPAQDGQNGGQNGFVMPGQNDPNGGQQGGWTMPGQDGQGQQGGWGGFPGGFSWDDSGHDLGLEFSAKGIKAGNGEAQIGGSITINGGTININSTDDSIHCSDILEIKDGDITVITADDAVHCDSILNVSGGKITVKDGYEGLEAMKVHITDGDINIHAFDDAVNAGEKGVKTPFVANENCFIKIDGGTIHAYVTNTAEGDCIDSNGHMYFNGGKVYAEGSVDGPDSAIDADGEIFANGGILVGVSGPGLGELPCNESQQYSLYWNGSTKYNGGSTVALLDGSGKELLSYKSENAFKCAVISSPDIQMGGSYTINVNGEKVAEFTVNAKLMKQGASGGFGGFQWQ
jgi:hypothetical protein